MVRRIPDENGKRERKAQMRIIKAGYEILTPMNGVEMLRSIEQIARTCYKSEGAINQDSAEKMVKTLIKNGHEAMLEHQSFSVKFIVDRGVSHELVRHRLASFAQESTRYCDYTKDKFGNGITFIKPVFFEEGTELYNEWLEDCEHCEKKYLKMRALGATPQQARTVLNHSTKTEVCVTMNLREWRHFFKLRAADETGAAHPQMKEVTIPLLKEIKVLVPVVFDDIEPKENT